MILVTMIALFYMVIIPCKDITVSYNSTICEYNKEVDKYNEIVSKSCVANIDGIPERMYSLDLVGESIKDVIITLLKGNSVKKVNKDINTINGLIRAMQEGEIIAEQVVAPSEDWTIERLSRIQLIKNITRVTEKNDINEMFGKEGGYVSCLYFELDFSQQEWYEQVKDEQLMYTDAGGAIEIYETVEDAEERCEYLAQFDDSILYTGSYAIVGTMVIRTSYLLSDNEQYDLTNDITNVLTSID